MSDAEVQRTDQIVIQHFLDVFVEFDLNTSPVEPVEFI